MKEASITYPVHEPAPSSSVFNTQNRDGSVSRLSYELAGRFGITANEQMVSKLQRIFAEMDSLELHRHVIELSSLPAGHPSWFDLVAKLTVHETYFFRDEPQLSMLRNKLMPHLIGLAAREDSPRLRILSAGCSSGEEVYSLAMLALDALLDAGYAYGNTNTGITIMPGWQLEIMGADVSAEALHIAQTANYTKEGLGSFRNMAPRWLNWFDDLGVVCSSDLDLDLDLGMDSRNYHRPKEFVRNITLFEQHNLLQSGARFGLFDMVICRNTMIYFNDANKSTAQNYLFDQLKPDGMLLLGATDPLLCPERCVQHRSRGMAFYTHKRFNLNGDATRSASKIVEP